MSSPTGMRYVIWWRHEISSSEREGALGTRLDLARVCDLILDLITISELSRASSPKRGLVHKSVILACEWKTHMCTKTLFEKEVQDNLEMAY